MRRPPHVPQAGTELEEFFDLSIDLLCVVGFDGCFKRVNPAFERTLGYPTPELFRRSVFDITHPDDVEPSREALAQLGEGHDLVGFESRVIAADGAVRWLEWNTHTSPERGVVYGVARDTTERRNADEAFRGLAEQQAALRRVATLVARGTPPRAMFAAVAGEVGEVLGVDATHLGRFDPDGTVVSVAQWGAYAGVPIGARYALEGESVSAKVLATGRPARMESYADAAGDIAVAVRRIGIRFSIGVPISVDGRPWGVMIVSTRATQPFPADTESRLQDFTELLATAISNASAHDRVRALADEQAALRRIATLVAQQAPQAELFAVIAEEIGRLLRVDAVELVRYEDDRFAVAAAGWGQRARAVPEGGAPLGDRNVAALVFHTGRAARLDQHEGSSAVGTPISAQGRLWGAIIATSTGLRALPPDTEARIGQFTDLMATAIANAEARAEVARLADEQAALRRVATLVARGAPPSAVFDAATAEVSELLGASAVSLTRYDGDEPTVVAQHGGARSVRVGDRATVAAPVVVDGRTWGMLVATWADRGPPSDDTEERMARFAELLDTAIANADGRDQLTASRARVLAAADDARRRVVRDLHDGAQQRLVHTIVTLKFARQALEAGKPDTEALVAEALGYADEALTELRELSHGILPSMLTRGGLSAAVDAVASRLELAVDVDVATERLPRDVEASAYFIVAEALTNVVKHARARRAAVRATVDEGRLRVEIRDDGVGGANPEGYGLVGIADRVDALGGELTIESGSHGGTVVVARLPLAT